jgi:hypothetical protein
MNKLFSMDFTFTSDPPPHSFLLSLLSSNMASEDDPFELIHRGNAFASSSSHWSAADAYSRATLALQHRAEAIGNSCTSSNKKNEEEQKIKALFTTQSTEYFYKARSSLLQAMAFENEQDRVNAAQATCSGATQEPMCFLIGSEEEDRRRQIFNRLFCTSKSGVKASPSEEYTSAHTDLDIDIPALPTMKIAQVRKFSLQTSNDALCNDSEQRLNTIKKGLERLGVSLPDNDGKVASAIDRELSTEDQVRLVIQQAADEVRVEEHSNTSDSNQICDDIDDIDENNSMFEGYQDQIDDESDLDALLIKVEKMVASAATREEKVSPNCANIDDKQRVTSLECHLQIIRDAQAMLLEARLCLELERESDNDNPSRHVSSTDAQQEMAITSTVDNNQVVSLKRRHNARERILSAIRCLQHGIEKLT